MSGWKTFWVGLLMAITPAATEYLDIVDWDALLGPNTAFFVSGLVMLGMRWVTTTPMFKKD